MGQASAQTRAGAEHTVSAVPQRDGARWHPGLARGQRQVAGRVSAGALTAAGPGRLVDRQVPTASGCPPRTTAFRAQLMSQAVISIWEQMNKVNCPGF